MTMDLLTALFVSLFVNILVFLFAYFLQTDKLTDLTYAATFVILAIVGYTLGYATIEKLILLGFIILWAMRLGSFLAIRVHSKGKDGRFDEFRSSFIGFGKFWLFQAIAVFILMIPLIFFMQKQVTPVFIIGAVIWLFGFSYEAIADLQKFAFTQNKNNKGKFIDQGLWKYSRHPNYVGEILCWVGIYIYVLPALTLTQALVGILSPIVIYIMLRYVSGVPLLEKRAQKKWGFDKAYQKYVSQTNRFIPVWRK